MHNEEHRHFTASVNLALDGTFRFRAEEAAACNLRAVAVAPNVKQSMDARDTCLVSIQVDPETEAYGRLGRVFAERGPIVVLPDSVADDLAQAATQLRAQASFDPEALWVSALDTVAGKWHPRRALDPRIASALDILKREFPEVPSATELASRVGLSPGRFLHVWKVQTGISLRRYVLWLRLRHVIYCISIGESLTSAAHESGFADSAHLSRTFRSMFGISMSSLFGSSGGVQLLIKFPEQELGGPHGPYDRERWAAAARIMHGRGEDPAALAGRWTPVRP